MAADDSDKKLLLPEEKRARVEASMLLDGTVILGIDSPVVCEGVWLDREQAADLYHQLGHLLATAPTMSHDEMEALVERG